MATEPTNPLNLPATPESADAAHHAIKDVLEHNRTDTFKGFFRGPLGEPDLGEPMALFSILMMALVLVLPVRYPHYNLTWIHAALVSPFALIVLSRYFKYNEKTLVMLKAVTGAFKAAIVKNINAPGSQLGIQSEQNGPAADFSPPATSPDSIS